MCHGRGLNNKINNLYERALRTVYQDKKSRFETLLKQYAMSNIWQLKYLKLSMTSVQKSWKKYLFFMKIQHAISGVEII